MITTAILVALSIWSATDNQATLDKATQRVDSIMFSLHTQWPPGDRIAHNGRLQRVMLDLYWIDAREKEWGTPWPPGFLGMVDGLDRDYGELAGERDRLKEEDRI